MREKFRARVAMVVMTAILAVIVCPANVWAQRSNKEVNRRERVVSTEIYFASGKACDEAIKGKYARFYEPSYLSLHKKIGPGERLVKLEDNQCFKMLTIRGYRWVAQVEGTEVVVKDFKVIRRYDCGNPILDTYHKSEEPVPQEPEPFRCPEGTTPGEQPGVCIQIIEKEKEKIVEKEKIIDNTCLPGPIRELLSYHEERKGFIVADIVRNQLPDKAPGILALVGGGNERATSVIVMTDGCSVGVKTRNVIRKGDKWKWVWIAIAAGGGFAAGYFLRPRCNKCKTQTPVKATPTTGSPTQVRPRRF